MQVRDGRASRYPSSMQATVVDDLPEIALAGARAAGRVAVDTETSGLDHHVDRLLLCQVLVPDVGVFLVRPKEESSDVLRALLAAPEIEKVFHFAPFDLKFLYARFLTSIANVSCTKAASKLLHPKWDHARHSLDALVKHYFGVVLNKGAVRVSDWGTPELSEEQIGYATGDVVHLLQLADLERAMLLERRLLDDFHEICRYMPLDARLAASGVPNPLVY